MPLLQTMARLLPCGILVRRDLPIPPLPIHPPLLTKCVSPYTYFIRALFPTVSLTDCWQPSVLALLYVSSIPAFGPCANL